MGGIGEINFGKQYRQGNRIYDSNAIAMCLNAQPVGNTGGYSYLYIIDDIYNNREPRVYNEYSPTLRAERQGLKVVEKKGGGQNVRPKICKKSTPKKIDDT